MVDVSVVQSTISAMLRSLPKLIPHCCWPLGWLEFCWMLMNLNGHHSHFVQQKSPFGHQFPRKFYKIQSISIFPTFSDLSDSNSNSPNKSSSPKTKPSSELNGDVDCSLPPFLLVFPSFCRCKI